MQPTPPTDPDAGLPGAAAPADLVPEPEAAARRKRKSTRRNVIEWVVVVGGTVVLALVVQRFAFQQFYVPSGSMEPTLHGCEGCNNDHILVNKLSYRFHAVHRGDIVVFERPDPDEAPPRVKSGECQPQRFDTNIEDLVKRVIGLPGETIDMRGGRVYVDGRALDEPYLEPRERSEWTGAIQAACTVPARMVFVMGDNRDQSEDSRFFGPIPKKRIVGRAFVRVWPPKRLGVL
jgi:signal peptidase I